GITKALRNGTPFDFASSGLVFIGYAIPAFAFGMVLKMLLCGTLDGALDIFPISGFESEGFDALTWSDKLADRFMHMFLPVLCYVIGNFAVLTMLMKNSLLDQIGQDYIRTVLAKGGTARRAIWGHAVRNALIPIATGFGGIMTVMFAGSVIIERVFEIPGMGRLSLDAIVGRDYAVFMGILALTSILGLLGRIVSDFCYLLIDPRITFER
ncbi:MAG: ABC transporter permease subunit, partial [Verrucomicrobia bacterium]|nr:ABC transporter permease subunit [Verrucomicrobiota bacterium]